MSNIKNQVSDILNWIINIKTDIQRFSGRYLKIKYRYDTICYFQFKY